MNPVCINCGLLRSTCEMEKGNEWTKNCQKIEGKKHEFTILEDKTREVTPHWCEKCDEAGHPSIWCMSNVEEDWEKEFDDIKYHLNVDEYLPKVKRWDNKNYDVPFDDGYAQAKKDFKSFIKEILVNSNRKTLQAFVKRVKGTLHLNWQEALDQELEEFLKDNK